MKKSLVVLLIAVLVAGSAFAAITGSASLSFGYDMDDEAFALNNAKSAAATFTFDVDSQSGATAEGTKAVYAKASGSYTCSIKDGALVGAVVVDDAYVMGEGWSVNFTKQANGLVVDTDYATVTGWYKQAGDWGIAVASKEITLADGLTLKANAGYKQVQYDKTNEANYVVDADISDDLTAYTKKNEDGTYKNAYLAKLVTDKSNKKTSMTDAAAKFAEEPTQANYKAWQKAIKKYNAAVAAVDAAITEEGMLKQWAKSQKADGYVSAGLDGAENFDHKYDVTTDTNIKKYYNGTGYYALSTDSADLVTLSIDEYKSLLGGKYDKDDTVYELKYKAVLNDDVAYKFVGKETIDAGLSVAYAKDLASASVGANIQVVNYEDDAKFARDLTWDIKGTMGYDFFKGAVEFTSDEVLNASLDLDLTKFTGYAFTFNVNGTDLLEKDSDEEINRVLGFGFDTVVADLTFGFDGSVDFTDKKVAFAFTTAYEGFTFGIDWATEYESSFQNEALAAEESKWSIGVDAGYACDYVKAATYVDIANVGITSVGGKWTDTQAQVKVGASVETAALIENATVKVAYEDAVYNGPASTQDKGSVTATLSVKF